MARSKDVKLVGEFMVEASKRPAREPMRELENSALQLMAVAAGLGYTSWAASEKKDELIFHPEEGDELSGIGGVYLNWQREVGGIMRISVEDVVLPKGLGGKGEIGITLAPVRAGGCNKVDGEKYSPMRGRDERRTVEAVEKMIQAQLKKLVEG